jgi:hypothetical protein
MFLVDLKQSIALIQPRSRQKSKVSLFSDINYRKTNLVVALGAQRFVTGTQVSSPSQLTWHLSLGTGLSSKHELGLLLFISSAQPTLCLQKESYNSWY